MSKTSKAGADGSSQAAHRKSLCREALTTSLLLEVAALTRIAACEAVDASAHGTDAALAYIGFVPVVDRALL